MRSELIFAGFIVIFIGMILIFVGMLSEITKAKGEVKGGGIILIGPFPIIFGTDKESVKGIILLTMALIIFVFALLFLTRWST